MYMLDTFEGLKEKFDDPISAKLAIFFHDVVYDPAQKPPENEHASAMALKEKLGQHIDEAVINKAMAIIEATASHKATSDRDTDLVLDIDMSVLGRDWEEYSKYAEDTMKEYVPVYGEEAYRQGRPELFLEPTIAAGNIFLTEEFRELEGPALSNMRKEAELLRSGEPLIGNR